MKVYIKTWGCSANQADSEYIAGLLADKLVDDVEEADVVILNSCSVKTPSENSLFRAIKRLRGKKVIVTGCVPEANKGLIDTKLRGVSVVGLNAVNALPEVIEEVYKGKRVVLFESDKGEREVCGIKINPMVEIVNIGIGCLNKCTYCATKLAKGNLNSFSEDRIIFQIKKGLKDGAKEIWLTSQDCAVYGFDHKTNLAKLLEKVCAIEGDFKVRVGMANPQYLIKFLDGLISAYKIDKIYKFLHIPIQSGSDKVLKDMRRGGSIKEFKELVERFRKDIPDITISTDIICGYPTETEEDWKQTIDLIKWLEPEVLNISKFWPRPGTEAANLALADGNVVKRRSKELTELFDSIAKKNNEGWMGRECEVLVNESGKNSTVMGRNFAYKPVVLQDAKVGYKVRVKIIGAEKTHLVGKIIKLKN